MVPLRWVQLSAAVVVMVCCASAFSDSVVTIDITPRHKNAAGVHLMDSRALQHISKNTSLTQSNRRQKRWVITAITVVVGVANFFVSRKQAKMQRKMAEQAARNYRKSMGFKLETLCQAICVTEWSHWSACTHPCGGGTRERTRVLSIIGKCGFKEDFECMYKDNLIQASYCNIGCYHGGIPMGEGQCQCQDGYHDYCCMNEVVCDHPGNPRNGKVKAAKWPATYQNIALVSCNEGFYMEGGGELMCQNNGTWSSHLPSCTRVTCHPPSLAQHLEILNWKPQYIHGDEIYMRCLRGHTLLGPDKRTCQYNEAYGEQGRWTGFDPECTKIKCPDPGPPLHGSRTGEDFEFGSEVTFQCAEGFKLVGSEMMTCQSTGQWFGRFPTCEVIRCEAPYVAENMRIRFSESPAAGTTARFSCDAGYVLEGEEVLTCETNGYWDLDEPTCRAAICGDPGSLADGARDGSQFFYPHSVKFICFNGFVMSGDDEITCERSGTWSGGLPICTPCEVGMFMSQGICEPCPVNMHTLTPASTSQQHCRCDYGYEGAPGGPCRQIRCPALTAPEYGAVQTCERNLDSVCTITCDPGFYLDGSSKRTCTRDETWSGSNSSCTACPKDTYQSGMRGCMPCPQYSSTDEQVGAVTVASCNCIQGYQGPPGGPCEDFDECETNGGRGPCEQACENWLGGYTCLCPIPGYAVADDGHSCDVVSACRNLTSEDAPDDGGLTCHHYPAQSSKHCQVYCNPGYEFPARVNNYEQCGPTTGFMWTYRAADPDAILEPCIEEFFPGFRTEADSFYFVRACADLTEEEQDEVKRAFAEKLNQKEICQRGSDKVCDVSNMEIICGRTMRRRRRRGVDIFEESLDFKFNVTTSEYMVRECDDICSILKIRERDCQKYCLPAWKRFLKAALTFAGHQLKTLFDGRRNRLEMTLLAARRRFVADRIAVGTTQDECAKGQKVTNNTHGDHYCVPCEVGHFYDKETNECTKCPVGSYQILPGQERCEVCPVGTAAPIPGSIYCQQCKPGAYGAACERHCECDNGGTCHWQTGDCICPFGLTGERCETDINGCSDHDCSPNEVCLDVPAPGYGFTCADPETNLWEDVSFSE